VLVIEGVTPFQAIKRSTTLLKETWGNQVAVNFGFGLAYLALIVIAVVPAVVVANSEIVLALVVLFFSAPVLLGGTVFPDDARWHLPSGLVSVRLDGRELRLLPPTMLRYAYVTKEDRRSWSGGGSSTYGGRSATDTGHDLISRHGGPGF
jgi:hypothetical protein